MTSTFVRTGLSPAEIHRRAGARRRWNAEQHRRAEARRDAILDFVFKSRLVLFDQGVQAKLAAHFQVDKSTICKDMRLIQQKIREENFCARCGKQYVWPDTAVELRLTSDGRVLLRGMCTPRRCSHYTCQKCGGQAFNPSDDAAEKLREAGLYRYAMRVFCTPYRCVRSKKGA